MQPGTETLDLTQIGALVERVFVSKRDSLHGASSRFNMASMCSTLVKMLECAIETVDGLPLEAFHPQPDDVDGNDVWCAGDIVGHLVEMDVAAITFWESVCPLLHVEPPAEAMRVVNREALGRDDCLVALTCSLRMNELIMRHVRDTCTGDECGVHFALGQVDVRSALLGTCLHLADHLQQLRALGETAGPFDNVFGSTEP